MPQEIRDFTAPSGTFSKDVGWYVPGPPKIPHSMRRLLETGAGIDGQGDTMEELVENIRDKAWEVYQYPCSSRPVGSYLFLHLGLSTHPSYQSILSRLQSSPTTSSANLLDLGCCIGQDIRSLVAAGIPGSKLIGVELTPAFIDLGYELFHDRDRLGARFIIADIFTLNDQPSPSPSASSGSNQDHPLNEVLGTIDTIWASAFLHLWNLNGQLLACRKLLLILADRPGVRVIGRQLGSTVSGEIRHVSSPGGGMMYKHSPASFCEMWTNVLGCVGNGYDGGSSAGGENDDKHGDFLRRKNGELWQVRTWFEVDEIKGEWLRKTMEESNGVIDSATGTVVASGAKMSKDEEFSFLYWELKRIR